MRRYLSLLLIFCMLVSTVLVFAPPETASAVDVFAGGDGTPERPYLVANKTQLNSVRNYMSSCFLQTEDITYNGTETFTPVGNYNTGFNGRYDGNGKKIINLKINASNSGSDTFIGMFANVDGAILKNIILENANVTGNLASSYNNSYIGCLAGKVSNSLFYGCRITGTFNTPCDYLTTNTNAYIGSLVGSSISNFYYYCSSSANITSSVSRNGCSTGLGGLIGRDDYSSINNCYFDGSIKLQNSTSATMTMYIGGLLGSTYKPLNISNCYVNTNIGGINIDGSSLKDIYLCGFSLSSTGAVSKCYANVPFSYNNVTATNFYKAEFAYANDGCDNSKLYYSDIAEISSTVGTACTLEQLKTQANYTGWDFSTVWQIDEGTSLPTLRLPVVDVLKGAYVEGEFAAGDGSAANPYVVATKAHLSNVYKHLDGFFVQSDNIEFNSGEYFTPIGTADMPFIGIYDGQGKSIDKLSISATSSDANSYKGMFGRTLGARLKNMQISNISLTGVTTGDASIGGLIGYASASYIYNCNIISGAINFSCDYSTTLYKTYHGGLVGYSTSDILYCSNNASLTVTVTRPSSSYIYIGGLAGYVGGRTIKNSSYTGTLTYATTSPNRMYYGYIGGLVGQNSGGTVSKCYVKSSALNITGQKGYSTFYTFYMGGLIGIASGSVTNNYCYVGTYAFTDATISNNRSGELIGNNSAAISNSYYLNAASITSNYGTALTEEQMISSSNFTGFDFNTVWSISEGSTPTLCTVADIYPAGRPVLTAGDIMRTSATEGTAKFTSDTAGQYYYSIVNGDQVFSNIDTSGDGTSTIAGENTITNPTGLATGIKNMYVRVKNSEGILSAPLKLVLYGLVSISGGSVSRLGDTEAVITFTSDVSGSYYYAIVDDGAVAPTIDTSGAGTAAIAGENTITNPTGLTAGAKDIYIKVKNALGNVSVALKIDIVDNIAPNLTLGAVKRINDDSATVKFTLDEAGQYYYAMVADGASAPIIDTSGDGTTAIEGQNTITNPIGLTTEEKDIYIKVKDSVGNVSNAFKIDVQLYTPLIPSFSDTPDPFMVTGTSQCAIRFTLARSAYVNIKLYDSQDNYIYTICQPVSPFGVGEVSVGWKGKNGSSDLADGTYKYKISADAVDNRSECQVFGTVYIYNYYKTAINVVKDAGALDTFVPTGSNTISIPYTLPRAARVITEILSDKYSIRTLEIFALKFEGQQVLVWDGKTDNGTIAKDGVYTYKIRAINLSNAPPTSITGTFMLDTSDPVISVNAISASIINPYFKEYASLTYTLSEECDVTAMVYAANNTLIRTLSYTDVGKGKHTITWDGKNSEGAPTTNGVYTITITALDQVSKAATPVSRLVTVYSGAPVISNAAISANPFTPTGSNTVDISYTLSSKAKVTLTIVQGSSTIKVLEKSVEKAGGDYSISWNGKNTSGQIVPDAIYTYRISALNAAGYFSNWINGTFTVDSGNPSITSLQINSAIFSATGTNTVKINFMLSEGANATVKVLKGGEAIRTLMNADQTKGFKSVLWDGKDELGTLVGNGAYTITVDATDSVGNQATQAMATLSVCSGPSSISNGSVTPNTFAPTGFNSVSISYSLSHKARVTIYIMKGTWIAKSLQKNLIRNAGTYSITWNGRDSWGQLVPEGTYTYKIMTKNDAGYTAAPITGNFTVSR